jgi:hypothetical protein
MIETRLYESRIGENDIWISTQNISNNHRLNWQVGTDSALCFNLSRGFCQLLRRPTSLRQARSSLPKRI